MKKKMIKKKWNHSSFLGSTTKSLRKNRQETYGTVLFFSKKARVKFSTIPVQEKNARIVLKNLGVKFIDL